MIYHGQDEIDAHIAISKCILSCANLENSLSSTIKNTIMSDKIRSRFGRLDNQIFKLKDEKVDTQLRARLNQAVRLISKIDAKGRYLQDAQYLQLRLFEAIEIRNLLCHSNTSFLPIDGFWLDFHYFKKVPRKGFKQLPQEHQDQLKANVLDPEFDSKHYGFRLSSDEISKVSRFIEDCRGWFFHCSIEIMYDYGEGQRPNPENVPKIHFPIWPDDFRSRPYPWS